MREWGDEEGFFWSEPIHVGRSASSAAGPRAPKREAFRHAAPPEYYKVPDYFPRISEAPRIVLDLEGTDPELQKKGPGWYRDAKIAGVGVSTDDWEGDYYPIGHKDAPNIEPDKVYSWLHDELKDYKGEIVGANLMYDMEGLRVRGNVEAPQAHFRDVLYGEPLLDENQFQYNLERLSQKYLGIGKKTDRLKELYGKDYIRHMDEVHPGHAREYNLVDLHNSLDVYDAQIPLLEAQRLDELFELENRLIPVLLDMREVGVRVDVSAAERLNDTLKQKLKDTNSQIKHLAGFEVNVNSADMLARAFDSLGLTYPRTAPTKRKPNGSPSFTTPWLEHHPSDFAQLVVAARKYAKFNGTFIEGYILNGNVGGLLRGQFHPLRNTEYGTVTGRFSSSNPNLQNIPTRDEILGPLVRSLFIPLDGCDWWALDYSQIEFRLLVHFAVLARCVGADVAQRMYQSNPNTDFHQMVADIIGWSGKHGRKRAKNINFGLIYGMGLAKLAASIGLSLGEAKPVLNEYHSRVPFAKALYNMASNRAQQAGFVTTLLNRRRRFDFWESKAWRGEDEKREKPLHYEEAVEKWGASNIKRAETHKSLNAVLQGGSADITKLAMVTCHEEGLVGRRGLPLHVTVHDELDGSKPKGEKYNRMLDDVHEVMTHVVTLKVPVLAEGSVGNNWAEAK